MKLQTKIEELLVKHPDGFTHKELARLTGSPEPSVRRAMQILRAGRPRFKVGAGLFDIVASDDRHVNKTWVAKWRTKAYTPTEVKVFITGEDGTKREVSSIMGHVKFDTQDNEPGDFDSGTAKVA